MHYTNEFWVHFFDLISGSWHVFTWTVKSMFFQAILTFFCGYFEAYLFWYSNQNPARKKIKANYKSQNKILSLIKNYLLVMVLFRLSKNLWGIFIETIMKQDRTESYQISAAAQFRDVANCHFLFYVERLFSKNDRQFPFSRNKMALLWIFQEKKKKIKNTIFTQKPQHYKQYVLKTDLR